jgi:endonuclease YncB( thermonuclease family)
MSQRVGDGDNFRYGYFALSPAIAILRNRAVYTIHPGHFGIGHSSYAVFLYRLKVSSLTRRGPVRSLARADLTNETIHIRINAVDAPEVCDWP